MHEVQRAVLVAGGAGGDVLFDFLLGDLLAGRLRQHCCQVFDTDRGGIQAAASFALVMSFAFLPVKVCQRFTITSQ